MTVLRPVRAALGGTLLALATMIGACGGDSGATATTALFAVPGSATPPAEFYEVPFPSDLRRKDDGSLDMTDYPRPNVLVGKYADAVGANLDGWGTNACTFARFSDAIDPTTLPADPAASAADGASVYLVNIDPASPDKGARTPLKFRFEPTSGETIGTNWLAALPYPGFPLDEATTYALVITDRVKAADGTAIAPAAAFTAIRGAAVPGDAKLAWAQTIYAPLWAYLDAPGGDERADVVSAAVFTTQHATNIMGLLRKQVWTLPAPTATDVHRINATASYLAYDGSFPAPNFQFGDVPYSTGGNIVLGTDGLPVVQRMENLRVAFTIPLGTAPAGGWPIAIYAHGTGGDYHSFINDGTASRLAVQGIASISIDQVLHGPRNPGGNPDIDFFNFQNPLAGRDNAIQGAADDFSVVRLVQGFSFVEAPSGSDPGRTITFDDSKIYFFGHSQGGLTGPPFLAYEPEVKGAILSGAGALIYYALLNKTQPFDITALLSAAIRDQPLDEFNPVLALLQTWIERSDAANYGPLLVRHPVKGPDGVVMAAKPIFQTEGFIDHYAPNPTIEAFAVTIGLDQVGPTKTELPGLALRGRTTKAAPVMNNLGGTTAALLQYDQATGSDGHFVVFDVPAAQLQSAKFLATLATTGTATVVVAP
jgi:predicted esterase